MDAEAARADIHELPSARGCTYVLPRDHFPVAVLVSQSAGESQEIAQAKKYLGVTDMELDRLQAAVLDALERDTLDPKEIKERVGDLSRSLGDEGKKRGMTTTLPMVLGRLQSLGEIRRVPVNGRLDQQRYKYKIWRPNPLGCANMTQEDAMRELVRLYFDWIGPASAANVQWFTGLTGKAVKEILATLDLVAVPGRDDLLIPKSDLDSLLSYSPPREPVYNLISGLDSLFLLRRDLASTIADDDVGRQSPNASGMLTAGANLKDLETGAIVDRGRLVGLWDYDSEAAELVWTSYVAPDAALKTAVADTEAFIRDQLGDCRSFSLDSPESRKPRLAALRAIRR